MTRKHSKAVQLQLLQVENWNLKHAVGASVFVTLDSGERRATRTRSEAQMFGAAPSKGDRVEDGL